MCVITGVKKKKKKKKSREIGDIRLHVVNIFLFHLLMFFLYYDACLY